MPGWRSHIYTDEENAYIKAQANAGVNSILIARVIGVSPQSINSHLAALEFGKLSRAKKHPARCLGCQGTFNSEGPHNRLCEPCLDRAADRNRSCLL